MYRFNATAGLTVSLFVAAMVLPAAPSSAASSTATSPAPVVTVRVVSVIGTGCPKGSAAVALSPDRTIFTVTYSKFTAQVGVGSTPLAFQRSCFMTLLVRVPAGYTYAVSTVDLRGYAYLESGATATQKLTYYFTGLRTAQVSHSLAGPMDDNWQTTDSTPVKGLAFVPCGLQRIMTIDAQLRVMAGSSNTQATTSFVTMDSTDGSFSSVFHLAVQKCRS